MKIKAKDKAGAVKDKAQPKNESHEGVEISEELRAKIDWIGSQFGFIRQWTGQDNREYATITPKVPKNMPEGYADVAEVAEEAIDELIEIGEDIGKAAFATYEIRYGRTRGIGRLIKVNDERKLTFALEVEHQVTGAKGGVQSFSPRADREEKEEAAAPASNFGFGKSK